METAELVGVRWEMSDETREDAMPCRMPQSRPQSACADAHEGMMMIGCVRVCVCVCAGRGVMSERAGWSRVDGRCHRSASPRHIIGHTRDCPYICDEKIMRSASEQCAVTKKRTLYAAAEPHTRDATHGRRALGRTQTALGATAHWHSLGLALVR